MVSSRMVVAAVGAGGKGVCGGGGDSCPHIGIIVEAARGEGWGVRFSHIYLCTRKISVETIRSQSDQTGT